MFFRKKKKVEKAKLDSKKDDSNQSMQDILGLPSNTSSKNTLPNMPPAPNPSQNSPNSNVFNSNLIPPAPSNSQINAMSITKPKEAPNDALINEKSKLFEPFRANSLSNPNADELKKTVIDNEKEIGKIASDISSSASPTLKSDNQDSYSSEDISHNELDEKYNADLYDYEDSDTDVLNSSSSVDIQEEPKDKFVSIAAYKQATKELNVIRKILSESSTLLEDVKSNVQEEAKNFSDLKLKLEDIERKIINLDQSLFGED